MINDISAIAAEVRACVACELHKSRRVAVPGEGPDHSPIILWGEAPGKQEDLAGRPFVGNSGRLLGRLLAEAGFRREDLFITNAVKCRPPRNRKPRVKEYRTCLSIHGKRQIAVIKPRFICLLGQVAAKALLGEDRITSIRAKIIERDQILYFPTFHPAAAIRSPERYADLAEDLKTLKSITGTERFNLA